MEIRKINPVKLNQSPIHFEPKRVNRWLLHFDENFDEGVLDAAFELQAPSFKRNLFGFMIAQPIKIKFYDQIGPSTSYTISKFWQRKNLSLGKRIFDYFFGKGFKFHINMLDPANNVVSLWEMRNCYITKVDFGKLAYGEDGVATVEVTIQPSHSILIF